MDYNATLGQCAQQPTTLMWFGRPIVIDGKVWEYGQCTVYYALLAILFLAGGSKIIFWSDWRKAVHLLPLWLKPNVLAWSVPLIEVGFTLVALRIGRKSWIIYFLRVLGFVFWTVAFSWWYFAPNTVCPCFQIGQYAQSFDMIGWKSLLKSSGFLTLAIFLDVRREQKETIQQPIQHE